MRRFAGDVAAQAPPDEKSAVDFTITNASLEFLSGVPPLRASMDRPYDRPDCDFHVASAVLDAGDDHVLNLSDGSFHIATLG